MEWFLYENGLRHERVNHAVLITNLMRYLAKQVLLFYWLFLSEATF